MREITILILIIALAIDFLPNSAFNLGTEARQILNECEEFLPRNQECILQAISLEK